jgi:hypothetical protein
MSRRPSILTAVIAGALLLLGALPAGASPRVPSWAAGASAGIAPEAKAATERAFSISRKDGNDVRGPLDLASMKISRGKTKDTVAFMGRGPISNGDLDINDGNLLILIDTNDAPPFEYGQYVFYAGGKLRGVLVNLGTNNIVDRTVPTSRTGPRGFRQVIQRAKIHSVGTYRFIAGSYYQGSPCSEAHACIDTIPNRYPPLIPLDHRAPSFGWDDWETYSGDVSDELTSPIEFHVADDQFGTGVKEWIVQRREPGGGHTWTTVEDGKGLTPMVDVPGAEGATYDLRTIVIDRQNNRKISTSKRTTLPFDGDAAVYNPLVIQDEAATGWFLGTRSGISNTVAPGTATFAFTGGTGTEVCVMGGPVDSGTATADVMLDGAEVLPLTEDVSVLVHSRIQCYVTDNANPHTLVVEGTSASTFWIDGFYVVP